MATRNVALKALLVAMLVSSLLVQGGADFHCCYCDCYINCVRNRLDPSIEDEESCHKCCFYSHECFPKLNCGPRIMYYGPPKYDFCKPHMLDGLVSRGMGGVAVAAGGGSLDKSNGIETGAAAAPSA